ncbi:MAG: GntR family transcriptional regulator [Cytophagales bacterium]|nr:GntR family transcriptional regulator [Cytophagales bacterium]
MDFAGRQPIYLQIVDLFFERILSGQWPEGERIPSVREMAVALEVNPNTAIRAYTHLQDLGVVDNRRGIGYFVSPGGREVIQKNKRHEFMHNTLPELFRIMHLLDISWMQLEEAYRQHKQNEK